MEFRIRKSDRVLFEPTFGKDAVADDHLSSAELAQAGNIADILVAAGAVSGQELSRTHGEMLLARALVAAPGSTREMPTLSATQWASLATEYAHAADALHENTQGEAAFSAYASALLLSLQAEAAGGLRGRARQDLETQRQALQTRIVELLSREKHNLQAAQQPLAGLRARGYEPHAIIQFLVPVLRDAPTRDNAVRGLLYGAKLVDELASVGITTRDEVTQAIARSRQVLTRQGKGATWLAGIDLTQELLGGLSQAGVRDPATARSLLERTCALLASRKPEHAAFTNLSGGTPAHLRGLLPELSDDALASLVDRGGGEHSSAIARRALIAARLIRSGVYDLNGAIGAAAFTAKIADTGVTFDVAANLVIAVRDAGVPEAGVETYLRELFGSDSVASSVHGYDFEGATSADALHARVAVIAIQDGKLGAAEALQFARTYAAWVGTWDGRSAPEALAGAVRLGMSPQQAMACLQGLFERNKHLPHAEVLSGFAALADLATAQGVRDPAQVRAAAHFIIDYGVDAQRKPYVEALGGILKKIDFPLQAATPAAFASAFAAALDRYVERNGYRDTEMFTNVDKIINAVHDQEHERRRSDSMRETLTSRLKPQTIYALIGAGGDALYSSTYRMLRTRFSSKVPAAGLHTWLAANDPERVATRNFFEALLGFNQSDLVWGGRQVFLPQAIADLDDRYTKLQSLGRLAPLLLRAYPTLSAEQRSTIDTRLAAVVSDTNRTLANRAGAAYLVKALHDGGASLSPPLADLATRLPAIRSSKPLADEWLADGAITMHAFTRADGERPKGFLWGKFAYFTRNGFQADRAAMQALGGKGVDLEHTIVLSRKLPNGVVQRLIASDDPSQDATTVDPSVDIVINRTHSYQLGAVYPTGAEAQERAHWNKRMLLMGGSCWSFRDMSDEAFLQVYGDHLVLAQNSIGRAAPNNSLMLRLLDGLATRKGDWSDIPGLKEFIPALGANTRPRNDRSPAGQEAEGFLPVDHPTLRIGGYVRPFADWQRQQPKAPPNAALRS